MGLLCCAKVHVVNIGPFYLLSNDGLTRLVMILSALVCMQKGVSKGLTASASTQMGGLSIIFEMNLNGTNGHLKQV